MTYTVLVLSRKPHLIAVTFRCSSSATHVKLLTIEAQGNMTVICQSQNGHQVPANEQRQDAWLQDNWEWSEVEVHADSPQPSPRDFLDMVALPGGQLLIFGGLEAGEKRSDETWVFDCSS